MATTNNGFITPAAGEGDWDTSNNANWNTLDRGYHMTGLAGTTINTGHVVWMSSGGYFFHYHPSSTATKPHGIAYYSVRSGDALKVLIHGTVTSLGITSKGAVPGIPCFTSNQSPGVVVRSDYAGPQVGIGLVGYSVLFRPNFF